MYSPSSRTLTLSLVGLAGVLTLISALGPQGMRGVNGLRSEVTRAQAREALLGREKQRLIIRVAALHDNRQVIESVARDALGLIHPGERVIRFEEQP